MRRRMAFACAVLAMATVISGVGAGCQRRVQDLAALDADAVKDGVTITPLLTRRRRGRDSGFRFEAIPDGISLQTRGGGRVDLYVNHETSKVPFPFNPGQSTAGPPASNGESDFDNSQVSQIDPEAELCRRARRLLRDPQQRRLPAVLLELSGHQQGGVHQGHPVHERGVAGLRVPAGGTRGRLPSATRARRRTASSLALDIESRQYHAIYGMGRHNHENDVAIPGFDELVVLSGDDTFTSGPLTDPGRRTTPLAAARGRPSPSCTRTWPEHEDSLRRQGRPLGVRLGQPQLRRLLRLRPRLDPVGERTLHQGAEEHRDREELRRLGDHVRRRRSTRCRPTNGSWQRDLRTTPAGIDGPQWVLEYWSQLNNVFDFVRVEDIAYDKRPGMGNVVYVVDSGRGTAPDGAPFVGQGCRRTDASGRWCSTRTIRRR